MSRHLLENKLPLYVVTHKSLSKGQQLAQTGHAVANFAKFLPERFENWHRNSEYLVVLEVQTSEHLENLVNTAAGKGLIVVEFREPDLGKQLTAIAFAPDQRNSNALSSLRLAGS